MCHRLATPLGSSGYGVLWQVICRYFLSKLLTCCFHSSCDNYGIAYHVPSLKLDVLYQKMRQQFRDILSWFFFSCLATNPNYVCVCKNNPNYIQNHRQTQSDQKIAKHWHRFRCSALQLTIQFHFIPRVIDMSLVRNKKTIHIWN